MRAIQISDWTEPGDLRVSTIEAPACGPREVRIQIAAAPVSFALSVLVAGKYQRKPALPFVPGNTCAGTVTEVGADVTKFGIGDRVLTSMEFGGLAEQAVAHEAIVYAIPDSLPFAKAVAFNTAYNSVAASLTWPHLLDIKPGHWLLVTGAAGGVGTAAIEIGRHLGATIIASASSEAKREHARACGAHHVIGAEADKLRDRVMEISNGGVDRVLEPVGGDVFRESLRCLRPEGRIVPIGFAGGEIPQVPVNLLLVKNIAVCGLYMGLYKIDQRDRYEPLIRELFAQLGRWFEEGAINPTVAATFSLDQVPAAFERVLDRNNIGHVVVEPNRRT